jgi:hypothetical protein
MDFKVPLTTLDDPYLILHFLTFAMFPLLRLGFPELFNFDTSAVSWFGVSKESQIYFMLVTALYAKYTRSINLRDWLYDVMLYLRICIVVVCFYGNSRCLSWFIIAFVVFGFGLKKQIYSGPTKVIQLTQTDLQNVVISDESDKTHVVLLFDPKSSRSKHFYRDIIELSLKYTSDRLRFYAVDISSPLNHSLMEKHGLRRDDPTQGSLLRKAFGVTSTDVPAVLCYRAGRTVENGVLPGVVKGKRTPLTVENMVNVFGLRDVVVSTKNSSVPSKGQQKKVKAR